MRRRIAPGGAVSEGRSPSSPPPPTPSPITAKQLVDGTNSAMDEVVQLRLPEVPKAVAKIEAADPSSVPPPRPEGELAMGMGTARIVSSIFEMPDAEAEYFELRKLLRMKDRASAMSSGQLLDELDQAADRAQRGAELVAVMKAAHDDFELLAAVSTSAMHQRAVDALLEENDARKAEKQSVKRTTKDDVSATIALMFPDEWNDLSRRRSQSKHAVAVVESLRDRLQERERALRAMVMAKRGE